MSGRSSSTGDWLKWLVSTLIALLAAGGGIVALLQYWNHSPRQPSPSTTVPSRTSVTDSPRNPTGGLPVASTEPTTPAPSEPPPQPQPPRAEASLPFAGSWSGLWGAQDGEKGV